MTFDMNTVWSRGIDLVRDNFQLLVVISGIFLLLPTLATYLLIPDFQNLIDPTADPEVLTAQMTEILGPLLGVGLLSMVFQFAGYGAMVALIGKSRPTVGQALKTGAMIVPSLFVVLILWVIAYFIGAMLISVPITLIAGVAGVPFLGIIAVFLVIAYVIWLLARMSMTMPAMVMEETLNPFTAILRSFSVTGPNQWQIMLFWTVLFVIYIVIALLVSGIFSLIGALMGGGIVAMTILGLFNGAMGMAVGMLISGLAVAMYSQLSGLNEATIQDTFE